MDAEELRAASLRDWDRSASGWERNADRVEEHARPVTDAMLAAARPSGGDRVLELACGTGSLGLSAARRVGPSGHAIVSDFASEMVEAARRRAELDGARNVRPLVLDAERTGLPADSVDIVLCRFGLMLMADPAAALHEMHRVVAPGGRIVVAVWGPASANPWASLPALALTERFGAPPPDAVAPGMFALGERERLLELFDRAGVPVPDVTEVAGSHHHASFDAWWTETRALTPAFADLEMALDEPGRADLLDSLRGGCAEFRRPDGALAFPSLALVASAAC